MRPSPRPAIVIAHLKQEPKGPRCSLPEEALLEQEDRMPRRVVVLAIVLLLVAPSGSAWAGGSWIEVTQGARIHLGAWDMAYASVGSLVTMRGDFSSGQLGAVSEGPWYAYLTSDVEAGKQQAEPTLLGPVRIDGHGGYPYVATVTFVVPSVSTGYYWVHVCDLGCTQGVGDLVGGTIVIGATTSEARLFARALIFRWMHDFDARTIGSLRKQREGLQAAIAKAKHAADAAISGAERANARVADAVVQVADSGASLEAATRQRDVWRLISGLSLLALLIAVASVIGLRRRLRAWVPDSPAGLIAQDSGPRESELRQSR
jgi:hypothetical protein